MSVLESRFIYQFLEAFRRMDNFKSPCFLTFSMVLPYTLLFINLNKSFSKSLLAFFLFSVLNSMNGFKKFACLKLIALWTF